MTEPPKGCQDSLKKSERMREKKIKNLIFGGKKGQFLV